LQAQEGPIWAQAISSDLIPYLKSGAVAYEIRSISEDCSLLVNRDKRLVIATYVNNLLLSGEGQEAIAAVKGALLEYFKMSDLDLVAHHVGVKLICEDTMGQQDQANPARICREGVEDLWHGRLYYCGDSHGRESCIRT
jgi:hypothetical protein